MANPITEGALHALVAAQIRLDPVNRAPTALPGQAMSHVNAIWGYLMYGFAILAAIAALIGLGMAMFSSSGRNNEGLTKVGYAIGCCIGVSAVAGIVGALTGT